MSFKEKNLDIISVMVPNAYVAYDTVLFLTKSKISNYGNVVKWQHMLESHICHEYFGLKYNPDLDELMILPREGIQLLIRAFETTRNGIIYTNLICSILKRDSKVVANLSKETLIRIYDAAKTYYILNRRGLNILGWDSHDAKQFALEQDDVNLFCYKSLVKSYFELNAGSEVIVTDKYIFYDSWTCPKIIDISTQKVVFSPKGDFGFSMCFSHARCAYTYGSCVDIYDIASGSIVKSVKIRHILKSDEDVSKLFFTCDGCIIVVINHDDDHRLLLIDAEYNVSRIKRTEMEVYRMCASTTVFCSFDDRPVAYSHDLKMMAIGYDKIIDVVDLFTGCVIRQLIGHTDKITHIRYSPDDSQIISTSLDRNVRIWNEEKTIMILDKFLLKENERSGIGNHLCFIIPDNYELIEQIKKKLCTKN
jgi:WD40 repeat protein